MARVFSNGTEYIIPVLAFLLAVAFVAPAAAANTITITNSSATAIGNAVASAVDGDTIVLSPGTYFEHNITITGKSLTIRANTTHGGSAGNTVIDAQSAGRIFNVTDTSALSIGNLALQNGAVADSIGGGAINTWGDVAISSSNITNCSADNGGAVNTQRNLTMTSSTISGCSCTASNCMGGAIFSQGNTTLITSTITGCRGAHYGGGIYAGNWGILQSSEISNCTSYSGGAVTAGSSGVILESSVISGCSAQSGGAIGTVGAVTIRDSSRIANCNASVKGGAINAGGAIAVTSSTITNCSAPSGGAVYTGSSSSGSIRFSRLVNDSSQGSAINASNPLTATDTWWGTNSPDFPALVNGPVTYEPWLVANISASPSSVATSQSSSVRVNITRTSAGTDTANGGIFLPDGIPVAWSFTGVSGSVLPVSGSLTAGSDVTAFTPSSSGSAWVSAAIDGQTVSVPVSVATAPTPTTSSHGRQNVHRSSAAGTVDEGYTGPQPTVMGYTPLQTPKPMITQKSSAPAPKQNIARSTAVMDMTQESVQKPASFPLAPLVIGTAVIVVVGAFLVRRWWIRRQNPALFRDYD